MDLNTLRFIQNKTMKKQVWEHGEIAFVKIDTLPEGLTESDTNVFAKGNTGNSHTFKGGKMYLKKVNDFVFGYFVAKNTKLYHTEHSPNGCELPDGVYEMRKQNEYINGDLRQVVD